MSREPCNRVGTPKAAPSGKALAASPSSSTTKAPVQSRGRSKKINWDKVRVFKQPEYRLPFSLGKYVPGKRTQQDPELWIQVAIESGLVEMGSLRGGGPVGDLLDPLNGNPPARMNREDLEALVTKGLMEVLEKS